MKKSTVQQKITERSKLYDRRLDNQYKKEIPNIKNHLCLDNNELPRSVKRLYPIDLLKIKYTSSFIHQYI